MKAFKESSKKPDGEHREDGVQQAQLHQAVGERLPQPAVEEKQLRRQPHVHNQPLEGIQIESLHDGEDKERSGVQQHQSARGAVEAGEGERG